MLCWSQAAERIVSFAANELIAWLKEAAATVVDNYQLKLSLVRYVLEGESVRQTARMEDLVL